MFPSLSLFLQLIYSCLLLALALCHASVIPATAGVALPSVPVLPVPTSHQFVTRSYNGLYVPTTTTPAAWPTWSSYPGTYYKYSGGYPSYSYGYPYGYYGYPSYGYPNYGYSYKSVW